MTIQTFSLEQAAGIICGLTTEGQVVRGGVRWLEKRLSGECAPQLPGYKQARRWRMTEQHIEEALRLLEPEHVSVPTVPSFDGMTRTSRRRLAS